MFFLAGIPSFFQLVGMFSLPESQRWLSRQNKLDQAKKTLTLIYKKDFVELEYLKLKEEVKEMKQQIELPES